MLELEAIVLVDQVLGFLQGRWPQTVVNPAAKANARAVTRGLAGR